MRRRRDRRREEAGDWGEEEEGEGLGRTGKRWGNNGWARADLGTPLREAREGEEAAATRALTKKRRDHSRADRLMVPGAKEDVDKSGDGTLEDGKSRPAVSQSQESQESQVVSANAPSVRRHCQPRACQQSGGPDGGQGGHGGHGGQGGPAVSSAPPPPVSRTWARSLHCTRPARIFEHLIIIPSPSGRLPSLPISVIFPIISFFFLFFFFLFLRTSAHIFSARVPLPLPPPPPIPVTTLECMMDPARA